MKVVAVSADTKQDVEAEMFDKVVYNLHPSFGLKAKQSKSKELQQRPCQRRCLCISAAGNIVRILIVDSRQKATLQDRGRWLG
jgi:hypothetical protein